MAYAVVFIVVMGFASVAGVTDCRARNEKINNLIVKDSTNE
ncbi:hypothetical protein [Breznakia pachnodae]|uniref:Uncharacterized protein n=1 Tax=Breznakia pachnodae TaxID=265178 RepID=A0ABU0E8J7_9FIRM|nr:hypothetical protein [Breznakia pachnodae]MDQ0363224.1 hypothetical protein [Breznakia pachnodae]